MAAEISYARMFDLTGTVSLVTGAAQGMGFAMSRALAEHGSAVVLADLNAERLALAKEELLAIGAKVVTVVANVADQDAPDRLMSAAAELGPLDVLINNAGIMDNGTIPELDDERWDRMMNINLRAPFRILRTALEDMKSRNRGSVINIGSSWSSRSAVFNQSGGAASYNATKAAIQSLTRSAAQEYAAHGVRVNAIAPGAVDTAMHAHHREFLYEYERYIPIGRMQQAHDIAGTAVFLASDASAYVTGQTLHVNGGLLMVD